MDLIPANIELSALEINLVNAMSREVMMRSLVESIKSNYDYVIIDCMLSLRMLTINALAFGQYTDPMQAAYLLSLEQLIKTIVACRGDSIRNLLLKESFYNG